MGSLKTKLESAETSLSPGVLNLLWFDIIPSSNFK
jgi:hypothetical protein